MRTIGSPSVLEKFRAHPGIFETSSNLNMRSQISRTTLAVDFRNGMLSS